MSPARYLSLPLIILFFFSCTTTTWQYSDILDSELAQRDHYLKLKKERLESLRDSVRRTYETSGDQDRYNALDRLYGENMSYCFDSAYKYSKQMLILGRELGPDYEVDSRTKYAFILSNGGFFKEAIDSIGKIDITREGISDKVLTEYYISLGRIYHNLSFYARDPELEYHYQELGNDLLAKALDIVTDPATVYWLKGKVDQKNGDILSAKENLEKACSLIDLDHKLSGIIYTTLAPIYTRLNDPDSAIELYTLAAIKNIRYSLTESVAIRGLATMLFYHKNEANKAAEYINIALDDAHIYSSTHRKMLIADLLPIFVGEKLEITESKRRSLLMLVSVITALALALVVISVIMVRQMKKLARQKVMLENMNKKLGESNLIKEEYIGHYFHINTEIITYVDRFVKVASRKLEQKQYESLKSLIIKLNDTHNKKSIYQEFDRTFLRIFPTFVEEFNMLLEEEGRISLPEGNLNPTLRIFALIRLGITDSEQIARVIDYSLNTVYNYRTRVKKKAKKEVADFEESVKKIGMNIEPD